MDERELYAAFKTSPLLTEVTKLIVESKTGLSVGELAEKLHKKDATVHKALRRLRTMPFVRVRYEGRKKLYQITPKHTTLVERVLAELYYPTKAFVVGELFKNPVTTTEQNKNAYVLLNQVIKGGCYTHALDVVPYEASPDKPGSSVGIMILDKLAKTDVLRLAGTLLDLNDGGVIEQTEGNPELYVVNFLVVVIDNGETREFIEFRIFDRYMQQIEKSQKLQIGWVLIQRNNPMRGIQSAQNWISSVLSGK